MNWFAVFFSILKATCCPNFLGLVLVAKLLGCFSFAMEVFSVLCAWRWHPWLPQLQIADSVEKTVLYKSQTLRKSHVIRKDHWLESWIVFFWHQVLWTSQMQVFFRNIPIGTRRVFPVLWKNMSLKAHGGCSMLSLFFSRECLISVFVLVFYPLVSSSSASAMSMASWNPLGVISHNRSHCRHGRYPAFMRLHFNHQTVPTGGKTSFPDICEARKEPLRVPSHAPSKGTTRLIDASSAVEDS